MDPGYAFEDVFQAGNILMVYFEKGECYEG